MQSNGVIARSKNFVRFVRSFIDVDQPIPAAIVIMKAKYTTFHILAIVLLNYAWSTWSSATPSLYVVSDLYEVAGDGNTFEHRVDNEGKQWKRKVNLERLEVLSNDLAFGLPFDSCLEDKLTNIHDKHDEQKSKFEEIHQVRFSFVTLCFRELDHSEELGEGWRRDDVSSDTPARILIYIYINVLRIFKFPS